MPAAQVPDGFWLLADPSQEVLIEDRPAFCQVAPVPLRQLGTDTRAVGAQYQPNWDR